MPKRIRYEGKVHVFPDDFTESDIQQALSPSQEEQAAKPPSYVDIARTAISAIPGLVQRGGQDVLTGAGKGAASTAVGLSKLFTDKLPGVPPAPAPKDIPALQPQGAGEKVGYLAEQTAEFFAPGSAVTKSAPLVSAALNMGRVPHRIANIVAPATAEGAAAFGVRSAQTGGDVDEAADAAKMAGGVSAAVRAAAPAIAPIAGKLKESAAKSYARALAPTTNINKALTKEKIVPEMLKRGVVGGTKAGLHGKFEKALGEVGDQLDDAWNSLPRGDAIPLATIEQAIDSAGARHFTVQGPSGAVPSSPEAEAGMRYLDSLKDIVKAGARDVDGQQMVDTRFLWSVRKAWDKPVAKKGGFIINDLVNDTKMAAKREAAHALRRELANAHPDIDVLNKEYSLWKNAESVMDATLMRQQAQTTPLGEQLAMGGGVAGGLAHGLGGGLVHGAAEAALSAAVLRGLVKFVRSPAYQTTTAVAKDRLADMMVNAHPDEVAEYLARLTASTSASSHE